MKQLMDYIVAALVLLLCWPLLLYIAIRIRMERVVFFTNRSGWEREVFLFGW